MITLHGQAWIYPFVPRQAHNKAAFKLTVPFWCFSFRSFEDSESFQFGSISFICLTHLHSGFFVTNRRHNCFLQSDFLYCSDRHHIFSNRSFTNLHTYLSEKTWVLMELAGLGSNKKKSYWLPVQNPLE